MPTQVVPAPQTVPAFAPPAQLAGVCWPHAVTWVSQERQLLFEQAEFAAQRVPSFAPPAHVFGVFVPQVVCAVSQVAHALETQTVLAAAHFVPARLPPPAQLFGVFEPHEVTFGSQEMQAFPEHVAPAAQTTPSFAPAGQAAGVFTPQAVWAMSQGAQFCPSQASPALAHRVPVPTHPAGRGAPQATLAASQVTHLFAGSQNFPAAQAPQSRVALQPLETGPQSAPAPWQDLQVGGRATQLETPPATMQS